MSFRISSRVIFILFSAMLCISANAKGWRTIYLDSYVSTRGSWEMRRSDTAGVETWRQLYGMSLLLISKAEVTDPLPADAEALDQAYAQLIQTFVQSLHGRLLDSSTVLFNGVIGKKARVAYAQPPNDSAFVAEAIFIVGNHRLYSFQYLHPEGAPVPDPNVDSVMTSIHASKMFTPDRQFEKKRKSDVFRRSFYLGQAFGYLLVAIAGGYFAIRYFRRRKLN